MKVANVEGDDTTLATNLLVDQSEDHRWGAVTSGCRPLGNFI